MPHDGRNTQRQLSAGSVQLSPFSPFPWWLATEHEPPLPPPLGQLPQSPGQSPQVSLPLQVPSPHCAAGGGEPEPPQLPQAEQLLPSPQQSPNCAQEASHQHPLGACCPQCPAHSLLAPG